MLLCVCLCVWVCVCTCALVREVRACGWVHVLVRTQGFGVCVCAYRDYGGQDKGSGRLAVGQGT